MLNLQEFLAYSAENAATDLEAALLKFPVEKRAWVPADTSRSALDLIAECALLNDSTATVITNRAWPQDYDLDQFVAAKAELVGDWERLRVLLHENTTKIAAVIRVVPAEDFQMAIQLPWRAMPLVEILAYPYWNMTYHLGQINYIASMLGCLE